MQNTTNINDRLPDGYDVIDTYQKNTEQSVVDYLFSYFGKVYYQSKPTTNSKNQNRNNDVQKIRNQSVSKYDKKLFEITSKRIRMSVLWAFIFFILADVCIALFLLLLGTSYDSVMEKVQEYVNNGMLTVEYWNYVIIGIMCVTGLLVLIAIICACVSISWASKKKAEKKRVAAKIKDWKINYAKFSASLSKSGIQNALQVAIPDLVIDSVTPSFDRKTLNLHNRIYSYCSIPQDAQKSDFHNLFSGFYKGNAFCLSYSNWEWYREAKDIKEVPNNQGKTGYKISRSLKRFEDRICVLAIDTFAEPRLNFVLNNPDGKNIDLQNSIFNKVFSLAVNDSKLAHKVFTPYVQHNLSRCKTWAKPAKAIRQVIKEGSKIYVVFDGKPDFFTFQRITDPKLNRVFISKDIYVKELVNVRNVPPSRKPHFASLDESASLMVEYILEELDVLYTALEMGTCLPYDDALVSRAKQGMNSLSDILNQKKQAFDNEKYTLSDTKDSQPTSTVA